MKHRLVISSVLFIVAIGSGIVVAVLAFQSGSIANAIVSTTVSALLLVAVVVMLLRAKRS
jgi:hypothetical protein